MRAVVYNGQGGVRVADVPDPQLEDDSDAIVRVTRAGICGTDLHLLAHPDGLCEGMVLGHEFIGVVESVGSRVSGVRVGDLVAGGDYVACGTCRWCRSANHWHCAERRFLGTGTTFGPPLPGAQAELVRVPFATASLRLLPARLDRDDAVLLGDVLATGYAAVRRARLRPGGIVAVLGGGPVGQIAATCAQMLGAGVVVVGEPVAERRTLAESAGSLVTTPEQLSAVLATVTDGRGADAVLDCVGGALGIGMALSHVRNAGVIVSVGVPAEPTWKMPVADCFARELTIGFAVGNFLEDADVLMDLLDSGMVVPDGLLSGGLGLDRAPEAYAAMANRDSVKCVLRPATHL